MIKRYSSAAVCKIIRRYLSDIMAAESAYGVPAACIQAVLYQELTGMDWLDPLADLAVACYWRFQPLWDRLRLPAKRDSSTGYGQIFAATAICAINFAYERGMNDLPISAPLDMKSSMGTVWRRLHGDMHFNIRCIGLCLLQAADEMTGSTDFGSFSQEELQLVFTRYNAKAQRITLYGKETYGHYQTFQGGSL